MNTPYKQSEYEKSSDYRYFPRWDTLNRVLFRIKDTKSTLEAQTKNISCSGTCLDLKSDVSISNVISLKIYLTDETAVSLEGRVVWNRLVEQNHRVGVMFQNTSDRAQKLILEHAFEYKKVDVVSHWYKGWYGAT